MSSYIYFTPATEVDVVNAIAEENGYGPNNISIQLLHADNSIWYGAHSFVDLMTKKPEMWSIEGLNVIVEYYSGGEPLSNWQDALTKNNLTHNTAIE